MDITGHLRLRRHDGFKGRLGIYYRKVWNKLMRLDIGMKMLEVNITLDNRAGAGLKDVKANSTVSRTG
ncbi:Hypothetical protein CINCED_3A018078, partial [Cinara cedri]